MPVPVNDRRASTVLAAVGERPLMSPEEGAAHDECVELVAELSRLLAFDRLTGPQQQRHDEIVNVVFPAAEQRWGAAREARLAGGREELRRMIADGARSEGGAFASGGSPSSSGVPGVAGAIRTRAMLAVEHNRLLRDEQRHAMALALDEAQGPDRDRLGRFLAAHATEAYERAYSRIMRDPQNGHREFDEQELAAWRHARAEARALNLADGTGQLAPASLDFTVQLQNAGRVNPMRGVARVVRTTTNTWGGFATQGVTASWDAESQEVSDDSPVITTDEITCHRAQIFAAASLEVVQDTNVGDQLAPLFADSRDELEAVSHVLGTGVGQPTGVVAGLASVPGSVVVDPAATAVTTAHAYSLVHALPPRWRARARFMANLTILNAYAQLPAGQNLQTPFLSGGRMAGLPVVENSVMDGVITGTANDYVLLVGDFSQYVIVDRIGLTMQFVPVLFGAARRPTGEAGWYAMWRTGADVWHAPAFRLLNLSA